MEEVAFTFNDDDDDRYCVTPGECQSLFFFLRCNSSPVVWFGVEQLQRYTRSRLLETQFIADGNAGHIVWSKKSWRLSYFASCTLFD